MPLTGFSTLGSSGTVGADTGFGDMGTTFEQLFWRAFDSCYNGAREKLHPNVIYIFELCTPDNKVVVDYENDNLPLLAARDAQTMREFNVESFSGTFDIATGYGRWGDIGILIDKANERPGSKHEGFVVVDSNHNRIKVKGKSYVQMHRVKGNGNPSFFELWKNNDLVEFWTYFPEYKKIFQELLSRIDDAAFLVEGFVNEYSTMNQKDFAAQVLHYHPKVSNAMFSIRGGKVKGFIDWLTEQKEEKFEDIFSL